MAFVVEGRRPSEGQHELAKLIRHLVHRVSPSNALLERLHSVRDFEANSGRQRWNHYLLHAGRH